MRMTSGFRKLLPSILGGALGIALVIYGWNAENLDAQILGLIIFTASMVVMIKTRQKITCDIEK